MRGLELELERLAPSDFFKFSLAFVARLSFRLVSVFPWFLFTRRPGFFVAVHAFRAVTKLDCQLGCCHELAVGARQGPASFRGGLVRRVFQNHGGRRVKLEGALLRHRLFPLFGFYKKPGEPDTIALLIALVVLWARLFCQSLPALFLLWLLVCLTLSLGKFELFREDWRQDSNRSRPSVDKKE